MSDCMLQPVAFAIVASCLGMLPVDSLRDHCIEGSVKSQALHRTQAGASFMGVYLSVAAFVVGLVLTVLMGSMLEPKAYVNKISYPLITAVIMGLFFLICTQAEDLVAAAGNDEGPSDFIGIYILVGVAVLLLCFNGMALVPMLNKVFQRRLSSKPNAMGVFLTLGAGAIIFGFLDNFGMKLGTDALEGKVFMSLGKSIAGTKSSVSTQAGVNSITELINGNIREDESSFKPGSGTVIPEIPNLEEEMSKHIDTLDDWSGKDYNKVINSAIRFAMAARPARFAESGSGSNSSGGGNPPEKEAEMKKLLDRLVDNILEQDMKPLTMPPAWTAKDGIMDKDTQLGQDRARIYMKDMRERFQTIKDASSMLGNTFSDFVGALLGAGVGKLFSYLSAIDGDVELSQDDTSMNANIIRVFQNGVVRVIMEAVFIAIGCLIPVWMHYKRRDGELHKTGVSTLETPVLLFVLICILLAGFMTEPVPDDDKVKTEDELEAERKNDNWEKFGFVVGIASLVVFSLGALVSMISLNSLDG
mmetsp:Transcript_36879/g.68046  ORF Transcript_36879/g.68046 Transcript_36879/m.68046 type:complete len:530 (-) Transcript_36879:37-1626(-)